MNDLDGLDWEIQPSATGMCVICVLVFFLSIVHEHLMTSVCQGGKSASSDNDFHVPSLHTPRVHNAYALTVGIPQLKSKESFSEGCHFWEVDISNMRRWMLGIACPQFQCYLEASSHHLSLFLGKALIQESTFLQPLK